MWSGWRGVIFPGRGGLQDSNVSQKGQVTIKNGFWVHCLSVIRNAICTEGNKAIMKHILRTVQVRCGLLLEVGLRHK